MPAFPSLALAPAPASLPAVWSGGELAGADTEVVATGHPALDAQLPGGGWPLGGVELLQQQPGQHVWQLLGPALAQALRSHTGPLLLVGAPFQPFGPGLQARGLQGDRLMQVCAGSPAARLWATEQALRCAGVAAVLAWLPQARDAELRRLQIAAGQHRQLLFVFRPLDAAAQASPARLRLRVEGEQELRVHILKRRGPPLEAPVRLPAQPARLAALLDARQRRPAPALPAAAARLRPVSLDRTAHALDRLAALA